MRKFSISLNSGFTLIEMLVVTAVFAALAILVSGIVLYSMRGSKKSESAMKVRAELENAIVRVERSLREAKSGTVSCNSTNSISFRNQDNVDITIACVTGPRLQMSAQDLVGSNVSLTGCAISCNLTNRIVTISLSGKSLGLGGVESDAVSVSSKIVLRNY